MMIVLEPTALRSMDLEALERLVESREFVLASGAGELRGLAVAALLLADLALLEGGASVELDSPAAWAGVVWRLGDRALTLHLAGRRRFDPAEALEAELVDEVGVGAAEWVGRRSRLALDAAAMLVARRGGDVLERVEFARLFAAGEPQAGMRAFLEKRPPLFG